MGEKKFYVYVLMDPRYEGPFRYEGVDYEFSHLPFYVGKGTGDRWRKHYHLRSRSGNNVIKNNLVAKLIILKQPQMRLLHTL